LIVGRYNGETESIKGFNFLLVSQQLLNSINISVICLIKLNCEHATLTRLTKLPGNQLNNT